MPWGWEKAHQSPSSRMVSLGVQANPRQQCGWRTPAPSPTACHALTKINAGRPCSGTSRMQPVVGDYHGQVPGAVRREPVTPLVQAEGCWAWSPSDWNPKCSRLHGDATGPWCPRGSGARRRCQPRARTSPGFEETSTSWWIGKLQKEVILLGQPCSCNCLDTASPLACGLGPWCAPWGTDASPEGPPWPRWQVPSQNKIISLADQSSVCSLLGFPRLEISWVGKKINVQGRKTLGSNPRGFRGEQEAAECCCCLLGATSSQEGRIQPAPTHHRAGTHSQQPAARRRQAQCKIASSLSLLVPGYHQPPKAVSVFCKCLQKGISKLKISVCNQETQYTRWKQPAPVIIQAEFLLHKEFLHYGAISKVSNKKRCISAQGKIDKCMENEETWEIATGWIYVGGNRCWDVNLSVLLTATNVDLDGPLLLALTYLCFSKKQLLP